MTTLKLPGSTLPFVEYQHSGVRYLEFDSTGTDCPVPMINAMAGLSEIVDTEDRLVMLNGFEPLGLYDKLEGCFSWQVVNLPSGEKRIEFRAIPGESGKIDFSDRYCRGKAV